MSVCLWPRVVSLINLCHGALKCLFSNVFLFYGCWPPDHNHLTVPKAQFVEGPALCWHWLNPLQDTGCFHLKTSKHNSIYMLWDRSSGCHMFIIFLICFMTIYHMKLLYNLLSEKIILAWSTMKQTDFNEKGNNQDVYLTATTFWCDICLTNYGLTIGPFPSLSQHTHILSQCLDWISEGSGTGAPSAGFFSAWADFH